jgi:Phosphotransferase enzyme family
LTWGGYAWLSLVTPVDATRFRTDDERMAATVVACGGILDESEPDIDVSTEASDLRPRGGRAVVTFSACPPDSGPWLARRSTRVVRGLKVRARAFGAARVLRRLGYVPTSWVSWEPDDAVTPRLPGWRGGRALRHVFPAHLELVADLAGRRQRTVFESAVHSAIADYGRAIDIDQILVRDTSVVAVGRKTVLRIELGGAGSGVDRQLGAVAQLRRLALPPLVRSKATSILAHGQSGLGRWSLEQRFAGSASSAGIDGPVMDQCIDFLVGLANAWSGRVSADLIEREADIVSPSCSTDDAQTLRWLARRIAARAETLPGVLAHGDFFHRNLVVHDGQLRGVVDWERSTLGRPALHDLVHLRVADKAARDGTSYGPAVVDWVRGTGTDTSNSLLRRCCSGLGVAADEATLLGVAASCWLAHVAHQYSRVADNASNARWIAENITAPVRDLAQLASAASL